MNTPVLVNGEPDGTINATDRGLQYGDGLFETLAVFDGECPWFDQHFARLSWGCDRLAIALTDKSLLWQEVAQCAADQPRAVVKVMLTRGEAGRGYRTVADGKSTRIVMRAPWPDYPAQHWQQGIRLYECHTRLGRNPALAGIKHLNRLEQVLARQEWAQDYAEGLLCDQQDHVIEGVTSNVFVVQKGELMTPDLTHCGVEGLMRNWVLRQASTVGIKTRVGHLQLSDLTQADEVFLTNSLIGLWPLREFKQQQFDVGPMYKQLFNTLIKTYPVYHA